MIKHIVMWQISGSSNEERARSMDLVKRAFESLNGKIPGMRMLEIGIDTSRVDYACDVVLYSEFDSAEALSSYANHPEHLKVREMVGGVRIARHQVDYHTAA
ncbi:Dabb family protein [Paraburkholderia sp. DHOC27]|uniref:Dabb family protein n=1 Tax=Paraburkholderia sp. DHOC27 TaxID=2303330 RepID=UPI000E3E8C0F|nr:Dabb family protein [Paraburkholderia sp. DHOC27]RFU49117.1 Dabb family protein [Paraburkholderia sp. DHOC27]